jgi:flagellar motor protein MotB
MIRRLGVAILLILLAAWSAAAQQQPAPSQDPSTVQQPAQQQQQQQQQQQEQQQRQQQREAQREAMEQERAAKEATQGMVDGLKTLTPKALSRTAPKQVTEPCLALEMPKDQGFDLTEIPLADWLAGAEHTDIPWRVEIKPPVLRFDQRYELGYTARIESKDLKWSSGRHEIRYVSGISGSDGRVLVAPKSVKKAINGLPAGQFTVSLSDCVLLQPGKYVLWMAVEDPADKRHSLIKKDIRVPEWPAETLPDMNQHLPLVDFPEVVSDRQTSVQVAPAALALPLQNSHPMDIEIVSVLSPADQWPDRADITRAINSRVLNATSILSQLRPTPGSVSTTVLDLTNRSIPFEQRNLLQLNWKDIVPVFTHTADDFKVDVSAVEGLKEHATFFRTALEKRLNGEARLRRAIILVSGSLLFAQGSNDSALKLAADCNCRVYHVWLRLTRDDTFDDLGNLIKPLRPVTYKVLTGADFRKAITDIVQDLDIK